MKTHIWLTISGIQKQEILEGLGFSIVEGRVTLAGVDCLDLEGNRVFIKDVRAVIGGKDGGLILITDVSEVELLEDEDN